MRTLHAYVTRQVLASLVVTIVVFTFVLLLGNFLKEVLNLILNGQATLPLVGRALGLLIPWVLVFALPMGMLTATLLTFGRLSADQELTAARAGGISLVALATPVLLLSVACSVLAGWINLELGPRCRTSFRDLLYRVGVERAESFLQEKRFLDDFENTVLYIGSRSGNRLENVLMYELSKDRRMRRFYHAERAEILSDTANVEAVLRLYNVNYYDAVAVQAGFLQETEGFSLSYRKRERKNALKVNDMTFWQLWETLQRLEAEVASSAAPPAGATAEQLEAHRQQWKSVKTELISPVRVQIHRQLAFSFACIGFTLVGIPLGVQAHRRETSAGIAIALLLLSVYYGFVILAQSLQDRPELGPHLLLWLPNFIFQVAGFGLLWRANRGL